MVQSVKKTTSLGCSQLQNGNISHKEPIKKHRKASRIRKRTGKGAKHVNELGREGGGVGAEGANGRPNSGRCKTTKPGVNNCVRNQNRVLADRIHVKYHDQRNSRVLGCTSAWQRKRLSLGRGPSRNVRTPVRLEFEPCRKNRLPAERKTLNAGGAHGRRKNVSRTRLMTENPIQRIGPDIRSDVARKELSDPLSLQSLCLNQWGDEANASG
jgi:hypothetical protein